MVLAFLSTSQPHLTIPATATRRRKCNHSRADLLSINPGEDSHMKPTQAREHTQRWAMEMEWPLVRGQRVCVMLTAHAGKGDLRGLSIQIPQGRECGPVGRVLLPGQRALERPFEGLLSYAAHAMGPVPAKREGKDCKSHKDGLWLQSMRWVLLSSAAGFVPGCSPEEQATLQRGSPPLRWSRWPLGPGKGSERLRRAQKGRGFEG